LTTSASTTSSAGARPRSRAGRTPWSCSYSPARAGVQQSSDGLASAPAPDEFRQRAALSDTPGFSWRTGELPASVGPEGSRQSAEGAKPTDCFHEVPGVSFGSLSTSGLPLPPESGIRNRRRALSMRRHAVGRVSPVAGSRAITGWYGLGAYADAAPARPARSFRFNSNAAEGRVRADPSVPDGS
jgi:hypothetical protein